MNAIFFAVFILSAAAVAITAPNSFLPALLSGAENALTTALTLFCVYAVFMGLTKVAEECGLTRAAARGVKPAIRRLFKTENDAALENISLNLACNLLGVGGAATPFAVKAVEELEKEGNDFAQKLLFIINATSIQLIPTTVIALRAAAGSCSPADIFLPSLICTVFSTVGAAGTFILLKKGGKLKRR